MLFSYIFKKKYKKCWTYFICDKIKQHLVESYYQRSVKFADQAVLLSVLVCFFVCNFIWYRMHLHWSHLNNSIFEFYKTIVLRLKLLLYIKGTLKQIWKSRTVFVLIWKEYPQNFASFILRILKLFARGVCKFLNKFANFYLILIFVHFFSQHLTYLTCTYLKMWKVF